MLQLKHLEGEEFRKFGFYTDLKEFTFLKRRKNFLYKILIIIELNFECVMI